MKTKGNRRERGEKEAGEGKKRKKKKTTYFNKTQRRNR